MYQNFAAGRSKNACTPLSANSNPVAAEKIDLGEMAGAGESARHPSGYPMLRRGEVFRAQRGGLGDVELPVLAGGGHSVNHAAVEVDSRALS